MKHLLLLAVALPLGLAFALLSGCGDTHDQVTTAPQHDPSHTGGHVVACQLCYDHVKIVRQEHGKGAQWSRTQIIREHQCPECKAMVTLSTKEGVAMFKCSKCAPEGVACDKCLPPRTGS